MIAMTTSSSIKVKPRRGVVNGSRHFIVGLQVRNLMRTNHRSV